MALDQVKNFGKSTVTTGYSAGATSIIVTDGTRFPDPASGNFNVVWWNSTDYFDPSDDPDREIVRVTAKSSNTLTVSRAQEGTSATAKNGVGKTYTMILAPTAKMITDIDTSLGTKVGGPGSSTDNAVMRWDGTGGYTAQNSVVTVDDTGVMAGASISGSSNTITNVPISTGVSGLGTGVATFLATPSSANLAAAVTDETGSGSLVFATSPTLVTPVLGTPTSGTLTNCTGLPISTGVSGLGANVATFLATPSSANLAAAVTDETGSGSLVFATSPTLTTPNLGTPSAATLTNATGLPLSTGVTGQLPLANGGTGANLTDPNADRILFWDDSAGNVTWLTVGTNLTITGTTLDATGGGTPGGSDTQVQFNDGGSFNGDAGLVYDKTNNKLSVNGTDTMTVNGSAISTHLAVHDTGGVAETSLELHKHSNTAGAGVQAYGARSRGTDSSPTIVSSGDVLMGITAVGYDGTDYATAAQIQFEVDGATGSNDMPGRIVFNTAADGGQTLAERMRISNDGTINISGLTASSAIATDSSKNLVSVTNTGTGNNVLATSPILVTPVLGTPTSGTLTNCTGLPISTGVSGLGTGVATFLATPSSANLATAVTDETGSGSLVFATSPTLVTPVLGTPTSGTLTNCTGLPLSTGVTGQLPLANGGTGANLVDPNADRIMFWDDSAGSVDWLTIGSNLSITGTTLNATGGSGSPGGSDTQVQFNDGGSFNGDAGFTYNKTTDVATIGGVNITGLTASSAVATDGSKNLVSVTNTGSGNNVLATSPTLVTPVLGTPTSGTLTNCTGLPLSTGVTGQLPLANGGTGANLVDPNADRLMFWDDSAGNVDWLTLGTNLSITGTTINASGSGSPGGSNTQVQFNDSSSFGGDAGLTYDKTNNKLSVNGDATITVSGVTVTPHFTVTDEADQTEPDFCLFNHNNSATSGAVGFFAHSRGTAASPTAVASGDTIGRFVALGYDGTDYATAAEIQFQIDGATGSNDMPGRIIFSTTPDGAQFAVERMRITNAGLVNIDGLTASSAVATDSSKNLVSVTNTGTGNNVLATSPTLTTPNLGTPSAVTLTNGTGLPLSTGVTGQLPLANGGTGANLTDPNADRIMFWDDSAGQVTWLEAGSGLSISGTTITASGGSGVTRGQVYAMQTGFVLV